jgi:hypothetical protein
LFGEAPPFVAVARSSSACRGGWSDGGRADALHAAEGTTAWLGAAPDARFAAAVREHARSPVVDPSADDRARAAGMPREPSRSVPTPRAVSGGGARVRVVSLWGATSAAPPRRRSIGSADGDGVPCSPCFLTRRPIGRDAGR